MSFLPEGYELPKSNSSFTKFEKDKTTRIRVLPSWLDQDALIFWEYFDESWEKPKPIRSIQPHKNTPWIKEGHKQKECWTMKVYNYDTEQVEICTINQASIKTAIMWFFSDSDYGDPKGYDLKITRTWDKLETKYTITPTPPKEFDDSLLIWKDKNIDWSAFLASEQNVFLDIE
jgi:hypothetical protein